MDFFDFDSYYDASSVLRSSPEARTQEILGTHGNTPLWPTGPFPMDVDDVSTATGLARASAGVAEGTSMPDLSDDLMLSAFGQPPISPMHLVSGDDHSPVLSAPGEKHYKTLIELNELKNEYHAASAEVASSSERLSSGGNNITLPSTEPVLVENVNADASGIPIPTSSPIAEVSVHGTSVLLPCSMKLVDEEPQDVSDRLLQLPKARLNMWYKFVACFPDVDSYLQHHPISDQNHCFITTESLDILIGSYNHFRKADLHNITRAHNLPYRSDENLINLKHRLLEHTCESSCRSDEMRYVFLCQRNPRRNVQGRVSCSRSDIGAISAERLAGIRARHLHRHERDRQQQNAEHENEIVTADTAYPEIRSFPEKCGLIKEWDAIYKTVNFDRRTCAVCGERELPSSPKFTWVDPSNIRLSLLRNDELPQTLLPGSYNLEAYDHAILNPKGLKNVTVRDELLLCTSCGNDLRKKDPIMPKLALANWLYYAHERLPSEIQDDFTAASVFERMLIARCSASKVVHRFSDKKDSPVYGQPRVSSQTYSQGNTVILPQDSVNLNNCLPPSPDIVRDTLCTLFVGNEKPTRENVMRLHPVLVRKSRVERLIKFLVSENPNYAPDTHFEGFSLQNLNALFSGPDDCSLPCEVDLAYLPRSSAVDSMTSDYTDRNEDSNGDGMQADDDEPQREILMENVGFTEGEYSSASYQKMKAEAVAHCLNGGVL